MAPSHVWQTLCARRSFRGHETCGAPGAHAQGWHWGPTRAGPALPLLGCHTVWGVEEQTIVPS